MGLRWVLRYGCEELVVGIIVICRVVRVILLSFVRHIRDY